MQKCISINKINIMKISNLRLLNLEKELSNAIKILPIWQKQKRFLKILNKKKFQLFADVMVNKIIKKIIFKNFGKKIFILSEENKKNDLKIMKKNFFCIIDPIDGSRSFYNQFSGYVSQICIIHKHKIIFSFIYAPSLNLKWVKINNIYFFNNEKLLLKKKVKFKVPRIIDNYKKPFGLSKKLMKFFKNSKYIESGSISLKMMLIFNNEADILIKDISFKIWDIAPTLPWMNKLGIHVKNLKFKKIYLNKIDYNNGLVIFNKEYISQLKSFLNKNEQK